MSTLNTSNHLRLTRLQILRTCLMHPLGDDDEVILKRYSVGDVKGYHIHWENGIEAYLVLLDDQPFPNSRQIVQAYRTETARVLLSAKEGAK